MGIGPLAPLARAVFLDRDGVLNHAVRRNGRPYPPFSVAEMEINPDAYFALPRLKSQGFLLIVVTNQPDVGRGTQTRETVESMHQALGAALPLDDFFVCYHDDQDQCSCRKPLPGLLLEAARQYRIDLSASFLIGDRWRDVDAGHAAGVRTVLIDCGYDERAPLKEPSVRVKSLSEAADWISPQ